MKKVRSYISLTALLLVLVLAIGVGPEVSAQTSVFINEIQVSTEGTDWEFVELKGASGTNLSDLTLLGVESDTGASAGTIDIAISLDGQTIPTDGFWLGISPAGTSAYSVSGELGISNNSFENSTATYFLVSGFTGATGNDLDTDDDGVLDNMPWSSIIDAINLRDSTDDFDYGAVTVGPDGSFLPSGTYRCPDAPAGTFNQIHNFSTPDGTPGVSNGCDDGNGSEPGDVVVNEIMPDPFAVSDGNGEWLELYNATDADINIDGWTIADNDSDSHVINNGGPLVIPAGGYLVLGNNDDTATNGGVNVDYDYGSSWFLANGADEVVLFDGTSTEIDRVEYDGGATFPDPTGASMALSDPLLDNNLGANWCTASTPYGAGDFGTPGAANDCDGGGGNGFEPGDVVVNEIMPDPSAVSDGNGEWLELYNATDADIDVHGWTIADNDSDSHVINNGGPLVIPAGGYLVLGNNTDSATNGGVSVAYSYGSSWFLANGADEVVLFDSASTEIDRVEYDGGATFPDPTGASMALADPELDNNVGANWCTSSTPFGDGDLGTPGAANDCGGNGGGEPIEAKIHQVQGNSGSVAITDPVIVEAVVVADYQRDDQLRGFFIQEEDGDADTDSNTSEGIFVFCGGCATDVVVGNLVQVTGLPEDFFGMSQIDATESGGAISVVSSGNPLPTAATIDLPAGDSTVAEATFENVEGMLVTFTDTLVVSEYFELARYGQLVLTAEARPRQFTDANEPSVSGYTAFLEDLSSRRIILDDDNNIQNDAIEVGPDEPYYWPRPGLSITNFVRGGDSITGLTGVLHWSFAGFGGTDAWRVRPVEEAFNYAFTSGNERPAAPEDVGGSLKVASFNVLNYFTTLDSRGADSLAELDRQREKIASAVCAMDADIVGLIEIENNGSVAIADLLNGVNGINVTCGPYDFIDTGVIGTDEIAVAFIYRTATVSPVGEYAVLDSSVDPRFRDDFNRPALAQTFEETATGGVLTVVVNHLKSKGSACDAVGDPDVGDGQGNCNVTRTQAAEAMVDWLATDPTGSGDADFLIIGDLNAYRNEDPIDALEEGADDTLGTADDYTDLLDAFIGPSAYTYLFDGQLGYLDHALASNYLFDQVTGVTAWHINADEIPIFDYNDHIRDSGEASFERESDALPVYEDNEFRSSDHDPVIVGLDLLAFDGFFPPVENPPTFNQVKAGSSVPIKFSLNGDRGLDILAPGSPSSHSVDCATGMADGGPVVGASSNSALTYDPVEDQYVFVWQTNKDWSGTCRQFTLTLKDGSQHVLYFSFR